MSRSFERKIIYAASAWQIVSGILTMFYYSYYLKSQGANIENLTMIEQKGVQSLFDSLYTFSVTYGLFFVVIAGLNIIFTIKILRDNTLQYKLPVYWIVLAIVFYFLNDFISLTLTLVAAIITLAKNKPMKTTLFNNINP